ncbi:carbohydrate ABC transporter permease [Microbacterium murale]|uniref:ABC-type glycerol-3-phosphate transport system permease component n=1 Tax=Microbacterium murale TaxID=1081040 RepID=A0ABU0P9K3_9MICO|nr:carbohydrate ABC transporter permease [Microbacterium murale]MDQ0644011.1 ABC-type glycerol-3-phosphate transport system permease component [Microbacterium murale]
MRKQRAARWALAVPMMLLAIATIYPMLYALNISMKTRKDYVLDRLGLAQTFNVQNFIDAWTDADMGRYFVNTIIATVFSVTLILILSSMCGYALSHLTFRGSKLAFLIILAMMMIPFQVIMVPTIKVLSDMGLINTFPGLIAAYVAQFLPFTVYFMTSYYSGIPKELTEAARVDGSGLFGTWWRIMVPVGKPALISMGILNALFVWNDILIALLIMQSPSNRTVMVGVSALRGQYPDNVPTYIAGVLLAVAPIIIVYLIFQRQISAGVTAGATKG